MKSIRTFVILVICVMLLMFGSGYAGMRLAYMGMRGDSAALQPPPREQPEPVYTNGGIGLMNNAEPPKEEINRALSLPDLFDMANPAVVAISTEIIGQNAFGRQVSRPSAGSGFLITSDGYIVTNNHVIENASSITVLTHDGKAFPAELIGRDPNTDLAVLKIDVAGFPFLTFGDSDAARVGEQVAAIGNPLGQLANSMTVGYISALNRDVNIDGMSFNKMQTDAAVNRGNSGGPLLNTRGEVVGVVSAKSTGMDVEGLAFAIPSNQALAVASQLMEYGYVRGRAVLGVTVSENNGQVQIVTVSEGSAADRAGLQAGDVILEMDGRAIASFADLRRVLDAAAPGINIQIKIRRGNEERVLTVAPDEYRPSAL
ncbi:MAG: trypsin-like peptidase domain-containing protein [Defluviitaleaceae bacterium]|nr:trypsin-like peptidase domain-containing protein [Defluviitaleaceae bacterium]